MGPPDDTTREGDPPLEDDQAEPGRSEDDQAEPGRSGPERIDPRRWAWLDRELDRWIADGVITDEQAAAIQSRYEAPPDVPSPEARTAVSGSGTSSIASGDDRDEDSAHGWIAPASRSRLVTALSIMGAILIAAGVLVFLGANWDDIPVVLRGAILVGAPLAGFGVGGWLMLADRSPRVGHGVWFLAAVFVGPAAVSLDALFELGLDPEWLLLTWALVAIPAGHLVASTVTTVLGLLVGGSLVFVLTEAAEPFVPLGLYAVVLFGLAGSSIGPSGRLASAYRLSGAILAIVPILWLSAPWLDYGRYAVEATPIAVAFGAVVVTIVLAAAIRPGSDAWPADRSDDRPPQWLYRLGWPVVAILSLAIAAGAATLAPDVLSRTAAELSIHAAGLLLLVATAIAGYAARSVPLVNLAVVLFVVQLFLFLGSTVADTLSGPIALVVSGVILLAVGLALERGRRRLLGRMR